MKEQKLKLKELFDKTKYFSLIELFVVISIISILFALILPSLNSAKSKSKEIICLSNERNISSSVFLFASDNDGHIKPNFKGIAVYDIDYAYEQYVDNPNVFVCPSAPPEHGQYLAFKDYVTLCHYGVFSPFNFVQAYNIDKGGFSPSEVRLIGEVVPPDTDKAYYWISEDLCPWNKSAEYRHSANKAMNIIFCDGHGEKESNIPLPMPSRPEYPPYIKLNH